MATPRTRLITGFACLIALPGWLGAQAAIDPLMAGRAAALAQVGRRAEATEMLGSYLSVAPDDAAAWLELGRLYIEESREWHRQGHDDRLAGPLLLDFAATALEQSLRSPTDSGSLLRLIVEIDRVMLDFERDGWEGLQARAAFSDEFSRPSYVVEAGRNLLSSCPIGGVLVVTTDLEVAAVWGAEFTDRVRGDLLVIDQPRYDEDDRYRAASAELLGASNNAPLGQALGQVVAGNRPVCLSPGTSPGLLSGPLGTLRLVRVAGPAAPEPDASLRVVDLLAAERSRSSALTREVIAMYRQAARFNPALCAAFLLPLGTQSRDGCSR